MSQRFTVLLLVLFGLVKFSAFAKADASVAPTPTPASGSESFVSKQLPWGGYWWSMKNGELVLGWQGNGKRAVWTPEEVRRFDSCLDSYSRDCSDFFTRTLARKEMSPLMKFDYYTRMRNERLRGPGGAFPNEYSHAAIWELENHYIGTNKNHRLYSNVGFSGKCIGWALSTMDYTEPTQTKVMEGVEFAPADLKGILATMYNGAQFFAMKEGMVVGNEYYDDDSTHDSAAFYEDVSPRDTILALQKTIKKGTVMEADLDPGHGVWNHPVFGYDLKWNQAGKDGSKIEGTLILHYATDIVYPDDVFSTRKKRDDFELRTLKFSLNVPAGFKGDFASVTEGGTWLGKSADEHPDTIIVEIEKNWRTEIYRYKGTNMKIDVNMPLFKRVQENGKWVPLLDLILNEYYGAASVVK